MAVKLSQSLKMTQSLAMTPQLQQAIKLLTLTHQEMSTLIAEEMSENPMLEEMDGSESEIDNTDSDFDEKEAHAEAEVFETKPEGFEQDQVVPKDDFDWDSYVDSFNSNGQNPVDLAGPDLDEDGPGYDNVISKGMTLAEHLEWQLKMETLLDDEMNLALNIINNLNDDGYLEGSFDEFIQDSPLDREDAYDVLKLIQRLDPVGCGAQNLQECLLAQAQVLEIRSPLLEKLIRDHLPDLQNKDYKKISKVTGVTEERIKDTAEFLKEFHPRPGRLINPSEVQYVVPDIFVVKVGEEFIVQVNDEGVPRLKISKAYQDMLRTKDTGTKEAREFVQEKLRNAMWLIKSIHNRQSTIFKVASSIVRNQQDFFKKGPKYLKPMILKDIAAEIGVHESTVSRVTNNKFMHTPIGVFELKYFFSTGVGGKNGGVDIASEVLKLKIKHLIDSENAKKPLSDQKIVELLEREDLAVARRTVTKYREMLGIDSSAKRKSS